MKTAEFDYVKKDGEKTHRRVMILDENNAKDYIDTVDLGHLTEDEVKQLEELQKNYEENLSILTKKAFRRFSKSGISEMKQS